MIERRQLRLVQPLNDRQHGCVNEANIVVGVMFANVTDTNVVIKAKIFNNVSASSDVIEQGEKCGCAKAGVNQIVNLNENGRRNYSRFPGTEHELPTTDMIDVTRIKSRIQWSCVEDQRHDRGTDRRSPASLAVSE